MPSFYLWLFFIWLPTAAQAHMLNMTEMSFDVSHQFETVLELKVDLYVDGNRSNEGLGKKANVGLLIADLPNNSALTEDKLLIAD